MSRGKLIQFAEFIKTYYPEFIIDQDNHQVIIKIGQWALRDPEFEDVENGWYLDKGIFIQGGVGTGKTKLMFILSKYLEFIRSVYRFTSKVVWQFAHSYKKDGISCFHSESSGNKYYDELCLTNDTTGLPDAEYVMHYGNKILVGSQLIMMRSNAFVGNGYMSHFTTNVPVNRLKDIYGVRAYDRLLEMCNFFSLTGESRRGGRPTFRNNLMHHDISRSAGLIMDDASSEKRRINKRYKQFCEDGMSVDNDTFDYQVLYSLGVNLATEEQFNLILSAVMKERDALIHKDKPLENMEVKRWKSLQVQYENKNWDAEERALLMGRAKMIVVTNFYQSMKNHNLKVIFEDV